MSRLRFVSCWLAILVLAGQVSASPPLDKLSRDARRNLATANYPHIYWLFVDSTAVADQPVTLTQRALDRRAKADPSGRLIDLRDYPIASTVLQAIEAAGLTIRHASRYLKGVSVIADSTQIMRAAGLPFVRRVTSLRVLKSNRPEISLDRYESRPKSQVDYEYGGSLLQNRFIQADRLHRLGITGAGVLIAIMDSGFDTTPSAFDSLSITATYDFINQDSSVGEADCPEDPNLGDHQVFHGTMVLGVIGGFAPDTLIGVAPDADFALAKTEITCDGTEIKLEEDNWIAAAEWADSLGADIITTSLSYRLFTDSGSYTYEEMDGNTALITRAADIAASKNIVVIASAGNNRNSATWNRIGAPADGDSVLAIGAVYPDSTITSFSSPGPTADGRIKPDLVTLGTNVFSVLPSEIGGYTSSATGTSFSAPLVAGGAALALDYDRTMTAEQFRTLARSTADRADHPDNDYGYGLFNAFRAAGEPVLNPIGTIKVAVGETREIAVTMSGPSETPPTLYLPDPPIGVDLVDNGDGSGLLSVTGSSENPPEVSFLVVAETVDYSDTAVVRLETYLPAEDAIFAGPNPFADSVRIFIAPSAGRFNSLSVFNVAGEKLFDKVNSLAASADSLREWTMIAWDGRNYDGRRAAAGVYLVVVRTDRQEVILKLLKSR